MLSIEMTEPKADPSGSLVSRMQWLSSEDSLPEAPTRLQYNVDQAMSAIARDAGPTYLCHMQNWATVELPANISEQVYSVHGTHEVRAQPRRQLSC